MSNGVAAGDVTAIDSLKNAEIRTALTQCIALRTEAKELEDEANTKKEAANEIVAAIFDKLKLTAVADANGSTIRKKEGGRSTLNKDQLREVLLTEYDMDESDINHIVDASSKTSAFVSYEFRMAK